ncbi:hypothetical protein ACJ73_03110 [Blastomyces percursus]|uniref:Uncharacterized protein n=1 Tax=Blastomyces percursus TaxID=1658174 RepID=A0A1J9RCW9_9EURO|nr:hypothetical protein ACJ73_03110 [Blastomyces percursus]
MTSGEQVFVIAANEASVKSWEKEKGKPSLGGDLSNSGRALIPFLIERCSDSTPAFSEFHLHGAFQAINAKTNPQVQGRRGESSVEKSFSPVDLNRARKVLADVASNRSPHVRRKLRVWPPPLRPLTQRKLNIDLRFLHQQSGFPVRQIQLTGQA